MRWIRKDLLFDLQRERERECDWQERGRSRAAAAGQSKTAPIQHMTNIIIFYWICPNEVGSSSDCDVMAIWFRCDDVVDDYDEVVRGRQTVKCNYTV